MMPEVFTGYGSTKFSSGMFLPQQRWLEKHFTGLEILAPYTCEFVGTFFLTFTVCCCILFGAQAWNAVAIASVLMASIYATAPLSGGHLNPAVSLACVFARKEKFKQMLQYMITQLLAGLFAGLLAGAIFCNTEIAPVGPIGSYSYFEASIVEVLYTAMLCFVVLNCAASERNNPDGDRNQFYALAIGFVIIAGGYAAGSISGAALNPAVVLAAQMVRKNVFAGFINVFCYFFLHIVGAFLGAAFFSLVRVEDYEAPIGEERALYLLEYQPSLNTRMLAEALGTFMVVFTFGLGVMQASPATGFATAACVMCMMYSLSNVSGGHFNPAVTLGVYLSGRRKCLRRDLFFYMIMQFLGGIVAAAILTIIFHSVGLPVVGLGPTAGFNWRQTFWCECIFTMILVYVVLGVATMDTIYEFTYQRHNFYFAFAIGACYLVGGAAIGPLTGGCLNPASALSLAVEALLRSEDSVTPAPPAGTWQPAAPSFGNCAYYIVYELFGAALAALFFHCTHAREFRHHLELSVSV